MIHTTLVLGEQFNIKSPVLVFTADGYKEIGDVVNELCKCYNPIIIDSKDLKFVTHMYSFMAEDSFYDDMTELSGLLQIIKTKFMNNKSFDKYVFTSNNNTVVIKHNNLSKFDKISDYVKENGIDICNVFVDSEGNVYYRLRLVTFEYDSSECVSSICDIKDKLESTDYDVVSAMFNELSEIYSRYYKFHIEELIANHDIVPKYVIKNNEIKRNCIWIGNYETPTEELQNKYNSIMENSEDTFTTLSTNFSRPFIKR